MLNCCDKTELRAQARDLRRSISPQQRAIAAINLLENLKTLEHFRRAKTVAMYIQNDGEIDPLEVVKWCWKNHKITYVPIVVADSRSLLFAQLDSTSALVNNRFGITEPDVAADKIIPAQQLDIVLLPLVAFDQNGNRVGMGGGFYDTTFAFMTQNMTQGMTKKCAQLPKLIGIAYEVQKADKVLSMSWDIPLNLVVTDKGITKTI